MINQNFLDWVASHGYNVEQYDGFTVVTDCAGFTISTTDKEAIIVWMGY